MRNLRCIPYALYDVYVYLPDANNANTRGGLITANGNDLALTMFNDGNDFVPYVESTASGPWSPSVPEASYVRFSGLSGDLTLITEGENSPTPRLRFSGFQIAAVPEPSSGLLLALPFLWMRAVRRRRRTV